VSRPWLAPHGALPFPACLPFSSAPAACLPAFLTGSRPRLACLARSWNNSQYSVIKGDGVRDLRCFPPKGIFEAPCWVPNDQDVLSRTCVISTEDLRCLTSGRAFGTEVRRRRSGTRAARAPEAGALLPRRTQRR
jgi:hypothetical protein